MTPRSRDSLTDAKAYALRLIGVRHRSRRELTDRLKRRGYPLEVIEGLIHYLQEIGLVDDRRLAQEIVDIEIRRRGRIGIVSRLRAMGFDQDTIRDAIDRVDKDTEESAALKIAQKKMKSLGGCDEMTKKRRLWMALKRRGFSQDIIERVMRGL